MKFGRRKSDTVNWLFENVSRKDAKTQRRKDAKKKYNNYFCLCLSVWICLPGRNLQAKPGGYLILK